MNLTTKQNQHLRSLAHHIKPVVTIGNAGLTTAVMDEIQIALNHHELIKIKIAGADKSTREQYIRDISTKLACHHVQSVGHVASFFKASKEGKIELSNK